MIEGIAQENVKSKRGGEEWRRGKDRKKERKSWKKVTKKYRIFLQK